jgi:hypothetical protein
MLIISAAGHYHKVMVDEVCIARANKQTGTEGNPDDPHWWIYPPAGRGGYSSLGGRRVETEEAAVSILSMICVMQSLGV